MADIFHRVCSGVPGLLHRQVAESATSALVQTNFLISALGAFHRFKRWSYRRSSCKACSFQ